MRDYRVRRVMLSTLGILAFATIARAQIVVESSRQQEVGPASEMDAKGVRGEFNEILNNWYPPTTRQVLQLEPSLLRNPFYLESYPKLAEFINLHPEVANSPTYFLGLPQTSTRRLSLEPIAVASLILGLTSMALWLLRFVIAHRRWLRMSRLQTEAQAKILERFSSNEDLLHFIQTPAGRRFLDASSVALEPQGIGAPVARILWSVQAGLILLAGGIGMEVLSRSSALDSDLILTFLIGGGIVIALGLGFLLSGIASYGLSRRFGLFDQLATEAPAEGRVDHKPPA